MRYLIAIAFSIFSLLSAAQTETARMSWQDIYNALCDLDDFDEEGWNDAYEILTSMSQSPQNINDATLTDLQEIPLLTESQASAIIKYRMLYGDIHSMAELSLITALDRPRIQLLKAVMYAAPAKPYANGASSLFPLEPNDSILQAIRKNYRSWDTQVPHTFLATLNIPTYEREGYKDGTYRGYAFSHTLRYRYQSRHVQAGITAAQDAGEPFFAGTNKKGWDMYTGFVRLKNIGIISNLVAGHYQMSVGMGLLINNDFRLSRSSLLMASPNTGTTLRGHGSRQQSNYLQGIATTITIPTKGRGQQIRITPFISYRAIDATMSNTSPQTITTILTTGYHRTDSEIARRNSALQFVAGTTLAYSFLPFHVSLNILHTSLSDSLLPDKSRLYNHYRPTGKSFTSGSLNYSYVGPRLHFSGETAVSTASRYKNSDSSQPAIATSNTLRLKVTNEWSLFALQRFYGYRYQSLLGKSFGDMSNCQDESGLYFGATTTRMKNLTLSAYIDCAYHPWARYGYDSSSRSWDSYVLAVYTHDATTLTLRYRYREQALAEDGSIVPAFNGSIDGTAQHTLRASLKDEHGRWTTMTQMQGTYLPSSADWGWLLSEGVGYKAKALSLWTSLTYFNTSDYSARLYLTDRNIVYGSTLSMLYGHGLRLSLMAESQLSTRLSLAARCNMLHYLDRNEISSGHQRIDSSNQTDISLQLQIRL